MVVGLTGMSGAGKSYVASRLNAAGFNIVDADKVYHTLVSYDSDCIREIEKEFGSSVINPDRSLNRVVLASIVFADPEKLTHLNKITHKYVLAEIRKEMSALSGICVVDAPQLFESGFDDECDLIIGVVADIDVCVNRIVVRDKITPEKARSRLTNQHDRTYFESRCDIIILNNGSDISNDIENTIKMIKEKNHV